MRISKKGIILGFVVTMLVCGLFFIKIASAQNDVPTDAQIQLVQNNCLSLKSTLNQLHASDALLRVNMGQLYESMAIKLMNGFNGRIENNNLNNNSLASETKSYNAILDNFRDDYQAYEQQLSAAINTDCQNHPASFYNSISLAQTYRDKVHTDVLKLNQSINQYQSAVDQFESDYLLSLEGTVR
jgi:outer membrane murein-binding lipoprotein Lpp